MPNSAVYEGHVWVQRDGGDFEMTKVATGLSSESRIAIKDGLSAGDVVARIPSSDFADEINKLAGNRPKQSLAERYGNSQPSGGGEMSPGGRGGPESSGRGGAGGGSAARGGRGGMPSFSDLDTDGDGSLTREELPAQMAGYFDALDTDGDGKVTEAQLKAAMSNRQETPE